jgi:hypothetical protein
LIKMTARVRTENAIQEVYDLGTRLHPHCTFKILHTFNDDVHGAPVANCKL